MESLMIIAFFVFILGICVVVRDAVKHAKKSTLDHNN
ncbi:hypothetical protein MHK_008888 [Candidatus Magnetomorum sp. HK-1]|nr:hypothetical protein MHK_008888 [Candidatus Magnetomorum sp. HK-1]